MSGIVMTLIGSLAGAAKDTFFRYVSLLLPGNGTNGAQNNTFLDGSTNNFTITRNGNTTQGTFTPYGPNWSNYFDGTGDYLAIPANAAFNFGTGAFTLECWAYRTGAGSGDRFLIDQQNGVQYTLRYNASGVLQLILLSGVALSYTFTMAIGEWYHIVAVRSGSSLALFVNGVRQATGTSSSSIGSNTEALAVGAKQGGGTDFFAGYISNVRIVKGTAVYDPSLTTLTVPTAPLTAITNTSLLTCQSNRFVDNSTNAFTITRNGDVSVQRFSPFNPTNAYSTSVVGGSGYFDGTGDYLTLPSSTLLLGSNNFTAEAWVYLTASPSTAAGIFYGQGDGLNVANSSYGFLIASATTSDVYIGGSTFGITSPTPTLNQWVHVAWVRTGGTFSSYLNGSRVGTRSDLGTSAVNNGLTTNRPTIGAVNGGGAYLTTGYISNARLVVGSSVYDATQSTITPPTSPLTAITNTQLLLNFTNAGIIDNAMLNDLETRGNAQISTAQSKFGGSSMAFDGTGDYMIAPNNPNYTFGTGDFTVECWVYLGASKAQVIWDSRASGPSTSGIAFAIDASNFPYVYVNGATLFTSSTALTLNTWTHLAFVKSSGTITLYINGVKPSTGSAASTTSLTDQASTVGTAVDYRDTSSTFHFNGYIDDLRITKGVARYTANFTPPSQAFPTS